MKKVKQKIKISKSTYLFVIPIGIFLGLYTISMILPLCWGFITSLKSHIDFSLAGNILGWPNPEFSANELHFSNYIAVIDAFKFRQSIMFFQGSREVQHIVYNNIFIILNNTILYAVVGALIQTFVPCVIGYIAARFPGKISVLLEGIVIFSMTLPIIGSSVATITLFRSLGLYDTFIGNWIQKFNFTNMYFLVFEGFFKGLSNSYSEAAEIDGASQFRTMMSIMLPLASKIFSTVFLILFISFWNDYQTPLLYLPTKATLSYAIFYITNEINQGTIASTPARIAGCMTLAIPALIIYIIFNKKLMGNISIGGVKE